MVLLVGLWSQLERFFVFFPTAEVRYTPEDVGLAYEEVFFPTPDGHRLHGWYIPGDSDTTLLWFHGNGGNIGHRVEELALVHARLGTNVFIFDYRGYGNSEGSPSERRIYRDAQAALEYLQTRPEPASATGPGQIVYFGRSLGAAVAIELAGDQPTAGLVLVAPFASLGDMARIAYPYLPLKWLLGNRYNSLARISQLHQPVLLMHGDQDEIVPLSQGKKLLEAANPPKKFQVLPGAGHNDTYSAAGDIYWHALSEFLGSLAAPTSR